MQSRSPGCLITPLAVVGSKATSEPDVLAASCCRFAPRFLLTALPGPASSGCFWGRNCVMEALPEGHILQHQTSPTQPLLQKSVARWWPHCSQRMFQTPAPPAHHFPHTPARPRGLYLVCMDNIIPEIDTANRYPCPSGYACEQAVFLATCVLDLVIALTLLLYVLVEFVCRVALEGQYLKHSIA